MKYLAALCILMSTTACSDGGLEIRTEHWDVPPKPAAGDSEHWDVPPNPAPSEDSVRYTPTLIPVRRTPICEDSHSLLEGPHGARFIVSRPLHSGEVSSFHYALDSNEVLWGVKKVALNAREAQRPSVTEEGLRRQLGLWDAVHPAAPVSRALLRHGHDVYALMPLMDGSVAALQALNERSTLARQMVHQVAGDAARLHALGFVHHDVRTQNILWDRGGTLALADFNLARHVGPHGVLERAPWYVVAESDEGVAVRELIAAPEVRWGFHDAKTDTWSLGLAAVEVLVGKTALFDALQAELAQASGSYLRWHASIVGAGNQVHLDRIQDPARVQVPVERRLYDAVFTRAMQQDPELTRAILGGMLVALPHERWSMQQVMERTPTAPREALTTALKHTASHHDEARRARREALVRCAAQVPPAAPQPSLAQDPRNTRQAEPDPLALQAGALAMPAEDLVMEDSGTSVRY